MKESTLRLRYWRIVLFFGRVVFGFIAWEVVGPRLGLRRLAERTRERRLQQAAARFRVLAIALGGLMIKLGQFLSSRLDVLPRSITNELSGLQDEVPAEELDALLSVATAELGGSLSQHFAWFDEEPLAAASLGQAHRARLRDADADELGFRDVVVKIQRPHIQQVIEVDLAALRRVGRWLTRYRPIASRANVPGLVEEFAHTSLNEVDYLAEAANAERFAENFAADARVKVPRIVWELTSRRVLTLEDVSAIKIADHAAISAAGIDRGQVATVLVESYLQQIFRDSFVHLDPHPGNLFVTPITDPAPGEPAWRLTFIDFGMMGEVPENLREGLTEALISVGLRDGARAVRSMEILDVILPGADMHLIERASTEVFARFGGMSMDELVNVPPEEMIEFARQFRELVFELPFQVPDDMLMLGRSVGILSGVATGLKPSFNVWAVLTPYAATLVSGEGGLSVDRIVKEAADLGRALLALPGRVDRVLTSAERGELTVRTPRVTAQVERLNRTARGTNGVLVFAALLLAGAVVLATDPVLGRWLMGLSAAPLLWAMIAGRPPRPFH
ncbi:AarF/ABC1/UbiB kinase family protein [Propioniciclava sinopodophylli]|uniref:AarF/ABC1/UbiB kinase family protein n=1 Tax=Propioniciclava sinopodophylli TaxID=1837344 RepID=A0A4Q9KB78_9ACTN|nr:AarF/UbiB family protein [Propioniciclava sinopodophylli]TBT82993.1 AarF/ABC1/UbiB kinase family protein [Propioniciclava sinopodophylli]